MKEREKGKTRNENIKSEKGEGVIKNEDMGVQGKS
jgi:hypothetical protein